jgi:hypothetical protein
LPGDQHRPALRGMSQTVAVSEVRQLAHGCALARNRSDARLNSRGTRPV